MFDTAKVKLIHVYYEAKYMTEQRLTARADEYSWLMRLYRTVFARICVSSNGASGRQAVGHIFDFMAVWKNFSYLLPRKTRERVFEPAYQDLFADHLETRRKRGKWFRRWLTFCFVFRTVLMVGDCFRALLADRGLRFLTSLLPEPLKRWWVS